MLLNLAVGPIMVRATSVVQSTVILPPPGGEYAVPSICVSTGCLVNASVSQFVVSSSVESGGNELEVVDALFQSQVYTNSGGLPGMLLGAVSIPGIMDITYFNRDTSVNPLGTFNAQITSFDFKGTLGSNTLEALQNPGLPSNGMTTINEVSISPVEYAVTSTFGLNGEVSLNGGPLVSVPTVPITLTPVPEPSYTAFVGFVLLTVLGLTLRRSRTQ
jgi:hypothetical protein